MNAVVKSTALGVVAIGRNEGNRLKTCIQSALAGGLVQIVVYVDSGSTDGSADYARSQGCQVINLDMTTPFTAARARNEGFALALQCAPALTHVQFIDGDCELVEGWLEAALAFMHQHPEVAAACGRRRERNPQSSVYNQLCDIEWNTPVGKAKSCGGDVLIRVDALRAVGGYRASLIAGEEPELCVRLRAAGWQVWRLDQEMTLHDAAMLRFGQWWNRAKRAGFAFAEGAALHGAPPERHWVRESRSAWLWGAVIPALIAVLSVLLTPWVLVLMLVYPLQVTRLYLRARHSMPLPGWYAVCLVLGKVPESLGQIKYLLSRARGKRAALIEYK
ncbi:MAG: glycosyltransferase family 2 protein [Pseudomonadota bacterium]